MASSFEGGSSGLRTPLGKTGRGFFPFRKDRRVDHLTAVRLSLFAGTQEFPMEQKILGNSVVTFYFLSWSSEIATTGPEQEGRSLWS